MALKYVCPIWQPKFSEIQNSQGEFSSAHQKQLYTYSWDIWLYFWSYVSPVSISCLHLPSPAVYINNTIFFMMKDASLNPKFSFERSEIHLTYLVIKRTSCLSYMKLSVTSHQSLLEDFSVNSKLLTYMPQYKTQYIKSQILCCAPNAHAEMLWWFPVNL